MSWVNKCSTLLLWLVQIISGVKICLSDKLHGLKLCAIMAFNMIFEQLTYLCTPHIYNYLSVRLVERKNEEKKVDIESPAEHGEVHYILDGVSTTFTTKIHVSFQTQLTERKETTQWFHHEANGDFKTVAEFN